MKILAVDYGDARTGLACCDPTEFLASPAGLITEWNSHRLAQRIAEKALELGCGEIVLGLPLNMNGSEGPRAQKCRELAGLLAEFCSLPVVLWDERCSTVTAAQQLAENGRYGKKRRQRIDEAAAVVILESYLASRKRT